MFDHKAILDKAVDDGVINSDQRWKLAPYFEGGIEAAQTAELDVSLDAPRDLGLAKQIEDSEAPRFIRGFHDVLITIGLVIALSGLSALTNILVVIVGAWVLAEILVKRQRLALPAVALTLIRAQTIAFDDYIALGGEVAAKEAGKARDEGKEYVTQDGDIMMFKFNT